MTASGYPAGASLPEHLGKPIVRVEGLEKYFGTNHVLRGIDLEVRQAEATQLARGGRREDVRIHGRSAKPRDERRRRPVRHVTGLRLGRDDVTVDVPAEPGLQVPQGVPVAH